MNILSYNIRGLGRGIKWASIRNLVGKLKVDLLCLQETKRDSFDKAACQALWGHPDIAGEWHPAVNTAAERSCCVVGITKTSRLIAEFLKRGSLCWKGFGWLT